MYSMPVNERHAMMMQTEYGPATVETYVLRFRRHSRRASRVIFADGKVYDFDELLSRREAIRNAIYQRSLGR